MAFIYKNTNQRKLFFEQVIIYTDVLHGAATLELAANMRLFGKQTAVLNFGVANKNLRYMLYMRQMLTSAKQRGDTVFSAKNKDIQGLYAIEDVLYEDLREETHKLLHSDPNSFLPTDSSQGNRFGYGSLSSTARRLTVHDIQDFINVLVQKFTGHSGAAADDFSAKFYVDGDPKAASNSLYSLPHAELPFEKDNMFFTNELLIPLQNYSTEWFKPTQSVRIDNKDVQVTNSGGLTKEQVQKFVLNLAKPALKFADIELQLKVVADIHLLLEEGAGFVLDEVDSLLDSRKLLNYPVGEGQEIPHDGIREAVAVMRDVLTKNLLKAGTVEQTVEEFERDLNENRTDFESGKFLSPYLNRVLKNEQSKIDLRSMEESAFENLASSSCERAFGEAARAEEAEVLRKLESASAGSKKAEATKVLDSGVKLEPNNADIKDSADSIGLKKGDDDTSGSGDPNSAGQGPGSQSSRLLAGRAEMRYREGCQLYLLSGISELDKRIMERKDRIKKDYARSKNIVRQITLEKMETSSIGTASASLEPQRNSDFVSEKHLNFVDNSPIFDGPEADFILEEELESIRAGVGPSSSGTGADKEGDEADDSGEGNNSTGGGGDPDEQPFTLRTFWEAVSRMDANKKWVLRLRNRLSVTKTMLSGLMQEAMSKQTKVHYGRSNLKPELQVAIPHKYANTPSENTRDEMSLYKDPWECICKSILTALSTPWITLPSKLQTGSFSNWFSVKSALDEGVVTKNESNSSITIANKVYESLRMAAISAMVSEDQLNENVSSSTPQTIEFSVGNNIREEIEKWTEEITREESDASNGEAGASNSGGGSSSGSEKSSAGSSSTGPSSAAGGAISTTARFDISRPYSRKAALIQTAGVAALLRRYFELDRSGGSGGGSGVGPPRLRYIGDQVSQSSISSSDIDAENTGVTHLGSKLITDVLNELFELEYVDVTSASNTSHSVSLTITSDSNLRSANGKQGSLPAASGATSASGNLNSTRPPIERLLPLLFKGAGSAGGSSSGSGLGGDAGAASLPAAILARFARLIGI